MFSFTKREWKFLIIIWLIVIILTFLPIILGYLTTPPDKVFLFRPNINGGDFTVYYSYIEQVKDGQIFFKNLFTSEDQLIQKFNIFWLVVGFFAKVFNLPSFLALQIVRFLLIPVFLVVAYYFTSFFFQEEFKRKLCFIFLVFASGWGWIFIETPGSYSWRILDLFVPEAFTLTTLYTAPHFIASLSLIILIFLFSIKAFSDYKLKYSLLAGALTLLLFSFHPYHIYTIFGVLFSFIVTDMIIEKRIKISYLKHCLIIILFSLPPVLYYVWLLFNVPVVYQHFLQNITLTPPLYVVLISYGLLIPLSLIGIISILDKKNIKKHEIFLIVWFFTQFTLLYLPIKTQIRLAEGLQFAVATLAVFGIIYLKDYTPGFILKLYSSTPKLAGKIVFIYFFIILFCVSSLNTIYTDFALYMLQDKRFYTSKSEYEAMVWLKDTPNDSIILSGGFMGNVIPAFSARQIFLGHNHETVQFGKKELELVNFFKNDIDQGIETFLKDNGIDYLFFGIEEKRIANFNPDEEDFLEKVYQNEIVTIYKVKL